MIEPKIIVIDKNKIKHEKLKKYSKMISYHYKVWDEKLRLYTDWDVRPGMCEYVLYSHLAKQFKNTIILDVGTGGGGSSKSLADNLHNKVISFDVSKRMDIPMSPNVEYRIGDFMKDDTIDYSIVSIIMIDVDPHDGIQEKEMVKFLEEEKKWSGILLMDDTDTDTFPEFKKYWQELNYEKYDLTDVGHHSGTGLINFGNKHKIVIKELS